MIISKPFMVLAINLVNKWKLNLDKHKYTFATLSDKREVN